MKAENPFQQAAQYWRVRVAMSRQAAQFAETAFDGAALAVSSFEDEKNPALWRMEILCDGAQMDEVKRRLLVVSALHGAFEEPEIQPVEMRDWVSDIARSFPPIRAGRFFVCGTHYTQPKPPGALVLLIDAGAAFGSGEHGTTHGCLMALEMLARRRRFSNVLDVGCGSGILAIAAAKRFRTRVTAVDLDPVAVRVTQENLRLNHVQDVARAAVSDGYNASQVRAGAPYDLIFANILARPLMALAPDLARNLAPGGVAVLSGLLASQEAMVTSAHRAQGLRLARRIPEGEWRTLVLH